MKKFTGRGLAMLLSMAMLISMLSVGVSAEGEIPAGGEGGEPPAGDMGGGTPPDGGGGGGGGGSGSAKQEFGTFDEVKNAAGYVVDGDTVTANEGWNGTVDGEITATGMNGVTLTATEANGVAITLSAETDKYVIENSKISVTSGLKNNDLGYEAAYGVGIGVETGELWVKNSEISSEGPRSTPIYMFSTSSPEATSLVVVDSKISTHTDKANLWMPPFKLLAGGSRATLLMTRNNSWFINSEVTSNNWGAISQDSVDATTYVINTSGVATEGGYGTYLTYGMKLYASQLYGGQYGAFMCGTSLIETGTAADALADADAMSKTPDYQVKEEDTVIGGAFNAVVVHNSLPNLDMVATGNFKDATLTTVTSDLPDSVTPMQADDEFFTSNFDSFGINSGSAYFYNENLYGSLILIRSMNADFTFDNTEARSSNGVLVQSVVTFDPPSASGYLDAGEYESANIPGIDVTFLNGTYTGDILHEDYQRGMDVTVGDASTLEGAIVSGTYQGWNDLWTEDNLKAVLAANGKSADTFSTVSETWAADVASNLTVADDTAYAETENIGVDVTVAKGGTWVVTGTSTLSSLTIEDGAQVTAPEGKTLSVSVNADASNANDTYTGGTAVAELTAGTYENVIITVSDSQPSGGDQPGGDPGQGGGDPGQGGGGMMGPSSTALVTISNGVRADKALDASAYTMTGTIAADATTISGVQFKANTIQASFLSVSSSTVVDAQKDGFTAVLGGEADLYDAPSFAEIYDPETMANNEGYNMDYKWISQIDWNTGVYTPVTAAGQDLLSKVMDGKYNSVILGGAAEGETSSRGTTIVSNAGGALLVDNTFIYGEGEEGLAISNNGSAGVGSTMVVKDSLVVSRGYVAENTASENLPNDPLLVTGADRTSFSGGESVTYYYDSASVVDGWASLSTDGASGNGVDLVAVNTFASALLGGYGTYADVNCRDYLYGVVFEGAEIGIIIAGTGEVYVYDGDEGLAGGEGSLVGADGTIDPYAFADADADYGTMGGSTIAGGRNAVMIHIAGSAAIEPQGVLHVKDSALVTDKALLSDEDTVESVNASWYGRELSKNIENYINYVSGDDIILRSTNGNIVLDNVEMTSYSNTLIHSVINNDTSTPETPADADPAGTTVVMKNMTASGNILDEDYEREMSITLDNATLNGKIVSGTCDSWTDYWISQGYVENYTIGQASNTFGGEAALDAFVHALSFDENGKLVERTEYGNDKGTSLTLTNGSVWNVTAVSSLTALTVMDNCTVNGTLVVDGVITAVESGKTYTGTITVIPTFTDVETGAWYYGHVYDAAAAGLMVGDGMTFRPTESLSRAEAAVIMLAIKGIKVDKNVTESGFTDADGAWYTPYVAAAKANGLVSGNGDGTFSPTAAVTRAEFATMLLRALDVVVDDTVTVSGFPDADGAWYTPYVAAAKNAGLTSGDEKGNFNPKADIQRAEAATMITAG